MTAPLITASRVKREPPGFLDLLADRAGTPLCGPPDACPVCVLLSSPLPGESRVSFGRRVAEASARLEAGA